MRSVLFVSCFLLLISCREKVIEAPKNLIPEERMQAILYDLALLNGAKGTKTSLLSDNNIEIMPFIFEKYKVDSIQFTDSDLYYASTPIKYQAIYEMVALRLEKEKKELDDIRKKRNDSVKKASQQRKDSLKASVKSRTNDSLPKK